MTLKLVSAFSPQCELRTTANLPKLSGRSFSLAGWQTKHGYHESLIYNRTRAVKCKFEVPEFAENFNFHGFIPDNDRLPPNLLPPSHFSPAFPHLVREGSNAFLDNFNM